METVDITRPPLVCLPVFDGVPDSWERMYMHGRTFETRMLGQWLASIETEPQWFWRDDETADFRKLVLKNVTDD